MRKGEQSYKGAVEEISLVLLTKRVGLRATNKQ